MYSPVFLSNPTTSGSPPVLSISLSDHNFSALASSFACTLAHSRPLWRFMFFSKRAFNSLSSSSRCSADKSLLLLMFRALVALIVVASRVSYLLLRCAPPHGVFFGLSLRSYQFAVSTPFGVHSSVHPRSPPPGEYVCVPSFPAARNRQENLGRLLHKRRLLLQRKHQISVPPCLRGQQSKFPAPYTKSRQSCVGVLFHPLEAQCNPAKVCCGHRVTP